MTNETTTEYFPDGSAKRITSSTDDSGTSDDTSTYFFYDPSELESESWIATPDVYLKYDGSTSERKTHIVYSKSDFLGRNVFTQDWMNGQESRSVYDRFDRLTAVRETRRLNPDPSAGLVEIESNFSYDALGRQIQTRVPHHPTAQTYFDGEGRVAATRTNHDDGSTSFHKFDLESGDLLSTTHFRVRPELDGDPRREELISTTYTHDDFGRAVKIIDPEEVSVGGPLGETTIEYSVDGNLFTIVQTTNDRNSVESKQHVDGFDRVIKQELPNGAETYSLFDSRGRMSESRFEAGPLEQKTEYVYDNLGRVRRTTQTGTDANGSLSETTWTDYTNGAHGLQYVHSTTPLQTSLNIDAGVYNPTFFNRIDTTVTVDKGGKTLRVHTSPPDQSAIPSEVKIETETLYEYNYDAGHQTQEVKTRNLREKSSGKIYEQTSIVQNTVGLMLEARDGAGAALSKSVYREDGNLVASYQRDASSFVLAKAFEYDLATGKPYREITFVGGGPAFGDDIHYNTESDDIQMLVRRYDSDGNLIEISDAGGNRTRNDYDLLGRVISQKSPDSKQGADGVEVAATERATTYEYSTTVGGGSGPVVATTQNDPNGNVIVSKRYPTANKTVGEWIINGTTVRTITSNHRSDAQVSQITSDRAGGGLETRSFTYDPLGRITKDSLTGLPAPGVYDYELNYTHIVGGHRESRELKIGGVDIVTNHYEYLHNGRLFTATHDSGVSGAAPDHAARFNYTANGKLHKIERFDGASVSGSLAIVSHYRYDSEGRLRSLRHTSPQFANDISRQTNHFNHRHQLAESTSFQCWDIGCTATNDADSQSQIIIRNSYDHAGQLDISDYFVNGSVSPAISIDHQQDRSGNPTGGTRYSKNSKLLSDIDFTYDYDLNGQRVLRKRRLDDAEISPDQPEATLSGDWGQVPSSYASHTQYLSDDAAPSATYRFQNLSPGEYEVYGLWEPVGNTAYAEWSLTGVARTPVQIDMQERPEDIGPTVNHDGATWALIGTVQAGSNGNITVKISKSIPTSDRLIAGRVMVRELVGSPGPLTPENLDQRAVRTSYAYDHRELLTEVNHFAENGDHIGRVRYEYDLAGRRISREVEILDAGGLTMVQQTAYYYDGNTVLVEADKSEPTIAAGVTRIFFEGVGSEANLSIDNYKDATAKSVYVLHDQQGTVRSAVETDRSGYILNTAHRDTSAVGRSGDEQIRGDEGLFGSAHEGMIEGQFGRIEFDPATGLKFEGSRFYDPRTVQFVTPKVIGFSDANPYLASNLNPTNPYPYNGGELDTRTGNFLADAALWSSEQVSSAWQSFNDIQFVKDYVASAQEMAVVQRSIGAIQVLGGVAEVALGVAACAGTFGAGCVAGIVVGLHGIDNIITGAYTVATGEFTDSGTVRVTSAIAGQFTDAQTAKRIGFAVDITIGIFGGGLDDMLRTAAKEGSKSITKAAAIHGAKHMAVAGGVTAGAGAVGAYQTGTWDGALMYASLGSAGGSLLANRYVKCFVAGTPVYVPAEDLMLATIASNGGVQSDSRGRTSAAAGALALGVAGYAASEFALAKSKSRRTKDDNEELDEVFDANDGWLDPIDLLWGEGTDGHRTQMQYASGVDRVVEELSDLFSPRKPRLS